MDILEKIRKNTIVGDDDCWEWAGGHTGTGRPVIWVDGKAEYVYRVQWILKNGPIPEGLVVRHICNNPGCVNPEHLLIGTSKENAEDAVQSGSIQRGTLHWNARLNDNDVIDIFRLHEAGLTQREIAKRIGCSQTTVNAVLNKRRMV